MTYDLSVIIPARNEEFLGLTINNILANKCGKTQIIAMLDGYLPNPPIETGSKDVVFIHHPESIGQRACVNEGARYSNAKYIMKLDGHCIVDKGFDIKLMADCEYDWTVIPRMYNLHAFDWKCQKCGWTTYQGPKPEKCDQCDNTQLEKKIVFKRRKSRRTDFMRFDKEMKFQYWKGYEKRKEAQGDIVPLMSSVGACFFMHRERFLGLGGLDEKHGSWGQFGTEIACKSWLSGGSHMVNKKTWFAHMFRTRKDFSFPYQITAKQQEAARKYSQDLWLNDKWPLAKRKLQWLLDKFSPIPDWDEVKQAKKKGKIELSVIIPARNEQYLQATIDDLKKNIKSKSYEILVGIDGANSLHIPKDQDNVRVIISEGRIGMRPMINKLVAEARGKYIMKTDAHCAFDEGYDQKLIRVCGDKARTVLGIRYELDVKAWGRKERTNCDFRYLSNPYVDKEGGLRGLPWHEWKKKTKGQKVAESMSLSGSGWLMLKEQWDAWGPLDEGHGTFGQEGAEIACRTWLSGGELLIVRDTWYAHWNRGKAPYALSRRQRDKSVDYSIDFWMNDRWPLQKYSFSWLIEKFNPPGWENWGKTKYGKGLKASRQGTLYKGYRPSENGKYKHLTINNLWQNRVAISEPLKRWRLKLMFDSFSQAIKELDAGNTFTDEQIRTTRYYYYLATHLAKDVTPLTFNRYYAKKWDKYLIKKFRSGEQLFHSIKNEGLKTPLEFYRKDGQVYLWKGYRRLVILKILGVNEIPMLVHIDDKCKKLPARFTHQSLKQKETIDELGAKQFIDLGVKSTDKYWTHRYTPIYDKVFDGLRNKKIKLLEFGVANGASLSLWQDAFPKAMIYGVDKNASVLDEFANKLDRTNIIIGQQEDVQFLRRELIPKGPFDIIIDDASHKPENQLTTLDEMWEALSPLGWYVIEDCYRSYKKGAKVVLPNEITKAIHAIYINQGILSIQFYYNICFIQKGV